MDERRFESDERDGVLLHPDFAAMGYRQDQALGVIQEDQSLRQAY